MYIQWVPYNVVLPDAHNVCHILINAALKDTCNVIITCMYYPVIINDVLGSSWLLSSIRTSPPHMPMGTQCLDDGVFSLAAELPSWTLACLGPRLST